MSVRITQITRTIADRHGFRFVFLLSLTLWMLAVVLLMVSADFQGLVVVPLFCGYDEAEGTGRLYTYDVVGGRYEEDDYAASGSGGREAKAYLRSVYRDDLSEEVALTQGIAAIAAAAEQDTATGGPDLRREIYSSAVVVNREGYTEISEERVAALSRDLVGDSE